MNSLIALGAVTSFSAGAACALVPGFALDPAFLEEPVMLLAFVLLGRSLEARARAAASADLTALARLLPDQARLVLEAGAPPRAAAGSVVGGSGEEEVMVPTGSLRAGDVVRVLPGERVPVDGVVVAGRAAGAQGRAWRAVSGYCLTLAQPSSGVQQFARQLGWQACLTMPAFRPSDPGAGLPTPSTVDESMLTGEARLVPLCEGSCVTGGTLAYEAPITLRATSTGAASALAGIGR
jgi:cation transport ATPase